MNEPFQPNVYYALTCSCGWDEVTVTSAAAAPGFTGWITAITCNRCGTVSRSFLVSADGRHWYTRAEDDGTLKLADQ